MPTATITSDGLVITCLLYDEAWGKSISIAHQFAGEVTEGLSRREARRPNAEAFRLVAAIEVTLAESEAAALRQTFATLGTGFVGLPLWPDAMTGSQWSSAGGRIYAPQRLIDLTAPAILATGASLIANHVYAPLLVGHIDELPTLKPYMGNEASVELKVTEDSPYAFRIGINAAITSGIWPAGLLADWSTMPEDTPEHGLGFDRIGSQRERVIADVERAFRWKQQAKFSLVDKSEIAALLGFFFASRGVCKPFTADVFFQPGEATAATPANTLFRFDSSTLTLDFDSTNLASAKVAFTQVPWEILGVAGETPEQPPRLFLYRITHRIPSPKIWRFTNCWRSLTRSGDGTYLSGPFLHDEITGGLDLATETTKLNSFIFTGNPLCMFNPLTLEGRLWLEIFEVESDPIDPDGATLRWAGSITEAPQEGRSIAAAAKWMGGLLDQEIPRARDGTLCNTQLFSSDCGHLKSAFQQTGTLAASVDNVLTVSCASTSAADTFRAGWVEVGSGDTWELRSITASAPVSGGQQLTIDLPVRQSASGQAVLFYRGCDGLVSTCKALDPSGWKARFRGFPCKPVINLSLPSYSEDTSAKK